MKPARENHERLAGVADAVTVAAVDMAVAAKVASEEATDEFANHGSCGRDWAGLDSNQPRRKASRFTVCPVWPLRYLPVAASAVFPARANANCRSLFEKFNDGVDYKSLRLGLNLGIDRQRQAFTGGAFCFRKIARLIAKVLETFLLMQTEWIINGCVDLAPGQMRMQLVALSRANDILM